MSKYDPLAKHLSGRAGSAWEATFEDIELILGASLPVSARKHRPWWANQAGQGHSQTAGWQAAGWETCDVNLEKERVRFVRRDRSDRETQAVSGDRRVEDQSRDVLFAQARQLTGIAGEDEIIGKALGDFVRRQGARQLLSLGGMLPGFRAPGRERPQE